MTLKGPPPSEAPKEKSFLGKIFQKIAPAALSSVAVQGMNITEVRGFGRDISEGSKIQRSSGMRLGLFGRRGRRWEFFPKPSSAGRMAWNAAELVIRLLEER
jgi:predicted small secreted protein